MRVIHKFGPFTPGLVSVECNKFVHFGIQDEKMYIWAEVDKENRYNRKREFIIIGTGWDFEYDFTHKQSLVTPDGYVWHLFQAGCIDHFANKLFN